MVTFNFVDVDLPVITKFISEITGKNFIFDERVKGKITIIAPAKISIDEAYDLFLSVLEMKGFTVVPSGVDALKIIPLSEAKQKGIPIVKEPVKVNEGYIVRVIPLKYITSEEAQRFLQPVISRDGYISSFGPGNFIMVVDSGMNIEKILSLLEIIDQPSKELEPEIIFLRYASSDQVARIINEGFGKLKTRPQQPQVQQFWVASEPRLNALIIFGDRDTKDSVKKLIGLLDVQPEGAKGRVNVYFLENADAEELAKVLDGIVKGAAQRPAPGAQVQPAVFESPLGITISPDKATNSLVIVASSADYQNLVEVIKQLDRKRRQVFVEAMIVEASIEKLQELGSRWRIIGRKEGEPVAIGGFGTIDTSTLYSIVTGLSGLSAGGMGNFLDIPISVIKPDGTVEVTTLTVPGFAALFSLDMFKDSVNVLSTPKILTSDNKEAEIVVGENVPFISKRERDPAAQNILLSSIERKDVGITLKITPQVTEGDYVKLDIYQEISAVKKEANTDILINIGPTTTKRSTKTTVTVKNKQTVVISGLMQERHEEVERKVPLLGDIPILGWLFKYKGVQKAKTNLLVFITPHIVKNSEDLENLTTDKKKEFSRSNNRYAEGEVIIRFKQNITGERIDQFFRENRLSLIEYTEKTGLYRVRLPDGKDVIEYVEELSKKPEIELVEPNYVLFKTSS
ncbi:MAG: type II secretion system secretin GspD [Thermodesulfovibrionales bacterium]|nr:type II secretion system secretin GspD [Thermodesulfovibrionales bacterium]